MQASNIKYLKWSKWIINSLQSSSPLVGRETWRFILSPYKSFYLSATSKDKYSENYLLYKYKKKNRITGLMIWYQFVHTVSSFHLRIMYQSLIFQAQNFSSFIPHIESITHSLALPAKCNHKLTIFLLLLHWTRTPSFLTWVIATDSWFIFLLLPLSLLSTFSIQDSEWCY